MIYDLNGAGATERAGRRKRPLVGFGEGLASYGDDGGEKFSGRAAELNKLCRGRKVTGSIIFRDTTFEFAAFNSRPKHLFIIVLKEIGGDQPLKQLIAEVSYGGEVISLSEGAGVKREDGSILWRLAATCIIEEAGEEKKNSALADVDEIIQAAQKGLGPLPDRHR
jgi:hypothetical protein